jgi:tetratricopeptide (TPR) repeat protein
VRPLLAALAALALLAPAARAGEPLTREGALAAIQTEDPEARRRATAALGTRGRMEDVPLLVGLLRDTDPLVRALAEDSLWQVWSRSGDPQVDQIFQVGVEQMNQGDPGTAVETFTEVIRRKPDFAEGWNRRATLYYYLGEYAKSLADCEEVIRRNPYHFGALSGFALNYVQLGQLDQAAEYWERALRVNPNLSHVRQALEELKRLLIERRKGTI